MSGKTARCKREEKYKPLGEPFEVEFKSSWSSKHKLLENLKHKINELRNNRN